MHGISYNVDVLSSHNWLYFYRDNLKFALSGESLSMIIVLLDMLRTCDSDVAIGFACGVLRNNLSQFNLLKSAGIRAEIEKERWMQIHDL